MINQIKDCIILGRAEYDSLIKENNDLKLELSILKKDNDLLRQNQISNLLTIEILRNENNQLKNEILELKKENAELKNRIIHLEQEIDELKKENLEIKKENKEIKLQLTKIFDKNYIDKIIYVCQDLNSKESLEKLFKVPLNKLMSNLRNDRNQDCHLILNTDNLQTTLCKEKIFYDKLINLTESRRKLLNKKIGSDLVDEIIKFLENKNYDSILPIIDNYEEEINDWFDE